MQALPIIRAAVYQKLRAMISLKKDQSWLGKQRTQYQPQELSFYFSIFQPSEHYITIVIAAVKINDEVYTLPSPLPKQKMERSLSGWLLRSFWSKWLRNSIISSSLIKTKSNSLFTLFNSSICNNENWNRHLILNVAAQQAISVLVGAFCMTLALSRVAMSRTLLPSMSDSITLYSSLEILLTKSLWRSVFNRE
jgi:hypothetical protein